MVDHNHPEPESLNEAEQSIRDYWKMPRTYEFDTEVREIEQDWIRLSRTFFYPEGGGQPSDRGYLQVENTSFNVVDVQERDNTIWLHAPNHTLTEGVLIHGKIDQYRRETLSRNHSAQHLLSAAFWEELEYDTTRALIDLRETELEFDHNPSFLDIRRAVEAAEYQIEKALPITSKFYTKDDISNLSIRGGIEGDHEVYRIVEINQYDRNPCGGTHVANTGEIKNLIISRIDGKRIKFMTGADALHEASQRVLDLHEVSRILTSPLQSVIEDADKLFQRKQELEKQLIKYEQKITELSMRTASFKPVGEYQAKVIELADIDRGQVLHNLGDLEPHQIAFVYNQNGTFILTAGDETLVQQVMTKLREQGVKGGGKGSVIMGKLTAKDLDYKEMFYKSLSVS
jgi:alanyl-tRNA synthetase